MVIGYDQKPEVITEFTDEPQALQGTLSLLRKTDQPRPFDALNVVMEDVLRPEVGFSKRAIVLVADGLDRGSTIKFEEILSKLQDENVTVYVFQIRDRTRGALRKDAPKAADALEEVAALRVVEVLGRQRLLRPGQPGQHVGKEIGLRPRFHATPTRGAGR